MKSAVASPNTEPTLKLQHLQRSVNNVLQSLLVFPSKDELVKAEWTELIKLKEMMRGDEKIKEKVAKHLANHCQFTLDQGMTLVTIFDSITTLFNKEVTSTYDEYTKNSILAADDYIPIVSSLICLDEKQLVTILEKFTTVYDVLEKTPYESGEVGYFVTMLHGCCKDKLDEIHATKTNNANVTEINSKNVFLNACRKLPLLKTQTTDNLANTQKTLNYAVKMAHTITPQLSAKISEHFLSLSQCDELDIHDKFLIEKNILRCVPAQDRIEIIDAKYAYQKQLLPWTNHVWSTLYNEFKVITDEKKHTLVNTYLYSQRYNFRFWMSNLTHTLDNTQATLNDFEKRLVNAVNSISSPEVIIKNLIGILVEQYIQKRHSWIKSEKCTKWFEKNSQLDAKQKEKYFVNYLGTLSNTECDITKLLAFILYKSANIGMLNSDHYIPAMPELNPENAGRVTKDFMQQCANDYLALNKMFDRMAACIDQLPSLKEYSRQMVINAVVAKTTP